MKFAVRVDDLGWIETGKPDRGLSLARRFHAAMQGLPYLGAVIPACLDDEGLAWLASAPAGLTMALHGWDHRLQQGARSEFHGLDLTHCRAVLDRGRRWLAEVTGVGIGHLVLPFNGYESEVADACFYEGIRYVWGGGSHVSAAPGSWPTPPQPYPLGRIAFVPSWAPTYAATLWRMSPENVPLSEALPQLLDAPGRAVLTLHITWEAAKCDDFRGVRWLVDLIGDRAISAEEYLA